MTLNTTIAAAVRMTQVAAKTTAMNEALEAAFSAEVGSRGVKNGWGRPLVETALPINFPPSEDTVRVGV